MANVMNGINIYIPISTTLFTIYLWCILIVTQQSRLSDGGGVYAWTTDIMPKLYIKYDQEKRPIFFGNQSDYFQILDQDDSTLLIGARNAMYNISLKNLLENRVQRLEWKSSVAHRELCALKGKQESDCQNYIRVYARIDDHKIMVCGTNSYKPLCRYYKNSGAMHHDGGSSSSSSSTAAVLHDNNETTENDEKAANESGDNEDGDSASFEIAADDSTSTDAYELINEIDGQGRCPYNPTHNSSYIFTDGQLYSATAADFSGGDALIYRENQRTEQFNAKQLNQPAFVSTVERNGYVFFFFREIALENTNCGKSIYSRVGRVCKNDRGGPLHFRERWTSYLKTRLNCSIPGDFPFYFDELQGTTGIVDGLYQAAVNQQQQIKNYHTADRNVSAKANQKPNSIIYAVFTTPQNAIPGSAVCAFHIDDIIDTFEGDFKGQKDATSNWLSIPEDEVPNPRPGKCVDDSRELPMRTVNFVKMHTLMESAVTSMYGRPLLTRVNSKHRFTAITTDAQIESLNGDRYDVMFVGTDNGRVIKFINFIRSAASNESEGSKSNESEQLQQLETVVITETQALPHSFPVKEMTVAKEQQSLIVVGSGHIVSIPLNHCSHIVRCRACLNLQDPYCVWDVNNHECTSISSVTLHNRINFIQNLRQSRKDSPSTIELCKKSGDDTDNWIDPPPQTVSTSKVKSLILPATGGATSNAINNNENIPLQQSPASTRGTVSSVGRVAPVLSANEAGNTGTDHDNEIRVTSIDGIELTNQINSNFDAFFNSGNGIDLEESGELGIVVQRNLGAQATAAASNNSGSHMTFMAHPMFASVVFIVFAVGLAIGFILSKRFKFAHSPFDVLRGGSAGSGSGHHHLSEHHRNQLNYYDKSNRGIPAGAARNSASNGTSGKDINLLMNVMGPYIAAGGGNNVNGRTSLTGGVNAGCQTPNNLNKKDILELEFETKDRSHECKNSTEHLDINDLKVANANNNTNTNCNNATITTTPTAVIVNTTNTGTLQKVKKTYL